MAGIGAQVVLYALFVPDVDEDAAENAGAWVFPDRNGKSALQHVLDEAYGLQAYGFSARVGAGDNENTLFLV